MIRIFIADDHELIREGLRRVLKPQLDMIVVGEARNTHEILQRVNPQDVDLVILDITLPGKSGLEVLKDLKNQFPKLRVLILSIHPEERFAVRALRAGASGYVTKQTAGEELIRAIRKIADGGKYVSPSLAEQLAYEIETHSEKSMHDTLSDREYEIMRMIVSGKTVSHIAEELSLSINTVATYRARMMEKMKMTTTAELIRYALEHRLVD